MRGFQPAKAAAKAQPFSNGGPVRGAGTGTSDDIQDVVPKGTYVMPADSTSVLGGQALAGMGSKGLPVNLSNGEFKMPPEQVHAVGAQVLDQIKSATHTPVGFSPAQEPSTEPEPRTFFADGGVVDDDRRQPISPANIFPQGNPSAGAPIYQGAGVSADQFGSSGQFAQVPASIGQQPGRQQAADASAPVAHMPAPAPAAVPAAATVQKTPPAAIGAAPSPDSMLADAGKAPATLYMQDRAQEMRGQIGAGNYAGAAGTAARTAVQGLGMYGLDIANALVNPVLDVGGRMVGGLLGTDSPGGQVRADAAALTAQPGTAAAGSGRGTVNPAAVNTSAPAPVVQPQATQVMDGVYRSGNSYADSAQAAITGAAPRGLPTYENDGAAAALAQRSAAESNARVTAGRGFVPGSVPVDHGSSTGGFTGVIGQAGNGNMWSRSPEQQRRDAQTQASSIHSPTAARGNAALQNLNTQDALATRDAGETMRAQLRDAGETGRTQIREQGDTGRAALREVGESGRAATRNALDGRRLGLEEQVRGFDIRSGQRQEKLQQQYEQAKTPEARAAISRQMRDLSGKAESVKDNFMAVGGGQEWDATAGVMRNVPQRLVDLRTGQEIGARTAGPKSSPVVGSTSTVGGKTAVWDGAKWIPR